MRYIKARYLVNILIITLFLIIACPAMAGNLHDQPAGTIITFSGRQWMVLDQMADGTTYIILDSNDGDRAFDPDNTQLFNPADSNNIGYYLNNTFYNSLSQKDLIEDHSWEGVNCKIALISYSDYNTYRSLFPANGTGYVWWIRTPASGGYIFCVSSVGSLNSIYYYPDFALGVRPALYLKSGIIVSDTNEVVGIKPPVPQGLTVSNISATGAKVTWNPVSVADSYNIYMDGSPVYNTTQTQYDITGLSPGTNHTVEVRAVISGVESDPATVSFATVQQQLIINVNNITQTTANALWNSIEGASSYNIYLNGTPIYNTTSNQYEFTGLTPGTSYTIEVKAVVSGLEASSDSYSFNTLPQEPPPPPPPPNNRGISFNVDMGTVYQQFANVFGSILPVLYPFIGALLAMFLFGGIILVLKGR